MAAKPIERFVKKQIQDQGGWPRILERLASGETVADVARTMLKPDGQCISRSFFSRLLHADQTRSDAVKALRPESADALVDEGLHLVDRAPIDRDSINKAKVQAELRLKVAGFLDRTSWGESKAGISVTVNTASLHVDALRHRQVDQPVVVGSAVEVAGLSAPARGTQDLARAEDCSDSIPPVAAAS